MSVKLVNFSENSNKKQRKQEVLELAQLIYDVFQENTTNDKGDRSQD